MDLSAPFQSLFTFLKQLFIWFLEAIGWLLGKVLYYVFDGLLTVVSAALSSLDLTAFVANVGMNWAGLPPQMIWFINAVGIPQGLTMLSSAAVIRLTLNLIPAEFTRI